MSAFHIPIPEYSIQHITAPPPQRRSCPLVELPYELLYEIDEDLSRIQDLWALSKTCQMLRAVSWNSEIALPVIAQSALIERTISLHPIMMLIGIARQIAAYAMKEEPGTATSSERSRELVKFLRRGPVHTLSWAGKRTKMNIYQIQSLRQRQEDTMTTVIRKFLERNNGGENSPPKELACYVVWLYSKIFHTNLENMACRPLNVDKDFP